MPHQLIELIINQKTLNNYKFSGKNQRIKMKKAMQSSSPLKAHARIPASSSKVPDHAKFMTKTDSSSNFSATNVQLYQAPSLDSKSLKRFIGKGPSGIQNFQSLSRNSFKKKFTTANCENAKSSSKADNENKITLNLSGNGSAGTGTTAVLAPSSVKNGNSVISPFSSASKRNLLKSSAKKKPRQPQGDDTHAQVATGKHSTKMSTVDSVKKSVNSRKSSKGPASKGMNQSGLSGRKLSLKTSNKEEMPGGGYNRGIARGAGGGAANGGGTQAKGYTLDLTAKGYLDQHAAAQHQITQQNQPGSSQILDKKKLIYQNGNDRHFIKFKPPKHAPNQISLKAPIGAECLISPPKSCQNKNVPQMVSQKQMNPSNYIQNAQLLNNSKKTSNVTKQKHWQTNLMQPMHAGSGGVDLSNDVRNSLLMAAAKTQIGRQKSRGGGVGRNKTQAFMPSLSTGGLTNYLHSATQNNNFVSSTGSAAEEIGAQTLSHRRTQPPQQNYHQQPKPTKQFNAFKSSSKGHGSVDIVPNEHTVSEAIIAKIQGNYTQLKAHHQTSLQHNTSDQNSLQNHKMTQNQSCGEMYPQVMISPKVQSPTSRMDQNSPIRKRESASGVKDVFEEVMMLDSKLKQELDTAKTESQKRETYFQVLDELMQKDAMYKPILTKIKDGLGEMLQNQDEHKAVAKIAENKIKEVELTMREKDSVLQKYQTELKEHERNEEECRNSMKALADQMDERDDEIESLQIELEEQRKRTRDIFKESMKNGGKGVAHMKADAPIGDTSSARQEMDELRELAEEMQEELDYGKQRENKLMFFLFVLKEKGFPISEVFENEIKDIPTTRFSIQFDDEYKQMYYQLQQERKQRKKAAKNDQTYNFLTDFSPNTERVFSYQQTGKPKAAQTKSKSNRNGGLGGRVSASFSRSEINESSYPVTLQQPKSKRRPSIVPELDLFKVLSAEKSSSSSSEEEGEDKHKRGPNPKQMKQILDKYNIHTCARNLRLQQEVMENKRKSEFFDEADYALRATQIRIAADESEEEDSFKKKNRQKRLRQQMAYQHQMLEEESSCNEEKRPFVSNKVQVKQIRMFGAKKASI